MLERSNFGNIKTLANAYVCQCRVLGRFFGLIPNNNFQTAPKKPIIEFDCTSGYHILWQRTTCYYDATKVQCSHLISVSKVTKLSLNTITVGKPHVKQILNFMGGHQVVINLCVTGVQQSAKSKASGICKFYLLEL